MSAARVYAARFVRAAFYGAFYVGAWLFDALDAALEWAEGVTQPADAEKCPWCRRWTTTAAKGELCEECEEIGQLGG